ncbi:MAG: transcription antitermination protein NusB [Bacteroidota bacterium]|nr:transcription antitermination protein NusB [Bacteroidota bacterium]
MFYAFFKAESGAIDKAEKELIFSINKSYDLYHYLLLLPIEIANYAESKIEAGQAKHRPSPEELNPNTRFINNPIIKQLAENENLNKYTGIKKLSWVNNPELIKNLYLEIISSDFYAEYMTTKEVGYEGHRVFVIDLYSEFIAQSDLMYQVLEEMSIYWNDDSDFILNMIIKTIKKYMPGHNSSKPLMPLYKNEDDAVFAKNLFRKAIVEFEENKKLIDQFTQNWELERIAFIDMLLISLAISEINNFSSIPIKVSFNEYIEIAKYYSTEKSSTYINGMLDKIIALLQKENKINKIGRGLISQSKQS